MGAAADPATRFPAGPALLVVPPARAARWTSGTPVELRPAVAVDGTGGVSVAWLPSVGADRHAVQVQRLDATGGALWAGPTSIAVAVPENPLAAPGGTW